MRAPVLLFCVLWGCVSPTPGASDCQILPPESSVILRRVQCSDELIEGGDGVVGDWYVATPHYRAVFRQPLASLTVAGLQGGTLIDLAPWGLTDRIHEIIPLVNGGWIAVEDMSVSENSLVLSGKPTSWPDQAASSANSSVEVIWTFTPETPTLTVSGNQEIWVHPSADASRFGGRFISAKTTLSIDGSGAEDFGGAVQYANAHQIHVRANADPFDAQYPNTFNTDGLAANATYIEFMAGNDVLGRYNLSGPQFTTRSPEGATGVRARGPNRQASDTATPGQDLTLVLHPTVEIPVQIQWDHAVPRPLSIAWEHPQLGAVSDLVLPEGGSLFLPEETQDLTISAGPHIVPFTVSLAGVDDTGIVLVPDGAGFAPYKWIQLDGISDRSKDWRGTTGRALQTALKAGVDWTTLTPEFDVASGEAWDGDAPFIRWRHGSRSSHPAGWTFLSWPWKEKSKLSGRGIPPISTLNTQNALASITGGSGAARFVAVTPGWFEDGDASESNPLMPTFVWVDEAFSTADPTSHLAHWFMRLDVGDSIPPVGSRNWTRVHDPQVWSGADIEVSLLDGTGIATTGPLLEVDILGKGPGDLITLDPSHIPLIDVALEWTGEPVDRLILLADGGQKWAQIEGPIESGVYHLRIPPPKRWMLAMGYSTNGSWAMTGPIWFNAPQ